MQGLKYSRQREAIKTFLMGRKDHPTADTIYTNVRQEFPNISLGTVYRNLALLCKIGEIQKISTEEGMDRFDGNPVPHYHFICSECGQVMDLELENMNIINQAAQNRFAGKIHGHIAHFYGECPHCITNNQI